MESRWVYMLCTYVQYALWMFLTKSLCVNCGVVVRSCLLSSLACVLVSFFCLLLVKASVSKTACFGNGRDVLIKGFY